MIKLCKKGLATIMMLFMLCFVVQADAIPNDDYPNSAGEAVQIVFGEDIVGEINYIGDKDYFGFIPEEKMNIAILIEGNVKCYIMDVYTEVLIEGNITYHFVDISNAREIDENEVLLPDNRYVIEVCSKEPNTLPNTQEGYQLKVVSKPINEETAWEKYGDVNDDGVLNAIDFALMRKVMLGQNLSNRTFDYNAADLNGDGSFNAIDFAWFNKYLLGQVVIFPHDKNEDGYIND